MIKLLDSTPFLSSSPALPSPLSCPARQIMRKKIVWPPFGGSVSVRGTRGGGSMSARTHTAQQMQKLTATPISTVGVPRAAILRASELVCLRACVCVRACTRARTCVSAPRTCPVVLLSENGGTDGGCP